MAPLFCGDWLRRLPARSPAGGRRCCPCLKCGGASPLPFLDVRAGKRDSHEMRDGGEFEVRRIRSLEPRTSNFLSRLTRLSLGPSPEDETLYKPIIFPHIDPAVHS